MGNGIALDTLAISKRLAKDGIFTQAQAEAITSVVRDATSDKVDESKLKDFATKADIASLRQDMADMEVRQTRALYNALIGFAAVIAAVVIGSISIAVLFLKS